MKAKREEAEDLVLKAAREKLNQFENRDESKFFKWEFGTTSARFLPIEGERLGFYKEARTHYFAGQVYLCLTEEWFGKDLNIPSASTVCPFCKRYNKGRLRSNKYPRGSEEGKKVYFQAKDEWGPRISYYSYVYDVEENEGEDVPDVQVTAYGSMLLQELLTEYVQAKRKFFSIKLGRIVKVTKKKIKGQDTKNISYKATCEDGKDNLLEKWPAIKEALPDMDALIPKAMAPEAIETIIKNNEIEFEEEEKPSKKKRSAARDEEDEEDDVSSDDESVEEEEKPKKKKKISSALENEKRKLRQKAGEDDDEDEDDEEEEESADDEGSDNDEEEEERPRKRRATSAED